MGIRSLSTASIATGAKRSKFWDQAATLGDYELIQTVVGDNSSRVLSISSIPSTYKHLVIRGVLRDGTGTGVNNAALLFNDDSGNNYTQHQAYTNNNSSGTGGQGYTGPNAMPNFATAGSPTGAVGYVIGTINDYTSSKPKVANIRTGEITNTSTEYYYILRSQMWSGTSAINKISFSLATGQYWGTLTSISLYGIKG